MSWLSAILLAVGRALRACWDGVVAAVVWLGQALDALSPLLSPVQAWINAVCTRCGAAIYWVLDGIPSWCGLVLISVVAGLVMVVVFRYTSNQRAIRRVRDDIKANLLVLRLFKEDLRVALRAQLCLLGALLRLQGHMLLPLAVMIWPMVVVMAQMNLRYQHRSLHAGERTVLRLRLDGDDARLAAPAVLRAAPALVVEVGPIAGGGQVVWRVRAAEPGRHTVTVDADGVVLDKQVVIGDGERRVSAVRPSAHWLGQLLYPAEPPLPGGRARALEIEYPQRLSRFDGADWWIVWFVVLSIASGAVCKSILGVAM